MKHKKNIKKLFKLIPIIVIIIFLVGTLFFKDGFNKFKSQTNASESSQTRILYDRINYKDYSENNLVSSKKTGRTILFFAATTWCSNCIALDKEIKAHLNELPKDVTILKVDYDNDKKMKAKYGVTMQTTLVLLDSNGREIKRWIGTSFFDSLLSNLK